MTALRTRFIFQIKQVSVPSDDLEIDQMMREKEGDNDTGQC